MCVSSTHHQIVHFVPTAVRIKHMTNQCLFQQDLGQGIFPFIHSKKKCMKKKSIKQANQSVKYFQFVFDFFSITKLFVPPDYRCAGGRRVIVHTSHTHPIMRSHDFQDHVNLFIQCDSFILVTHQHTMSNVREAVTTWTCVCVSIYITLRVFGHIFT